MFVLMIASILVRWLYVLLPIVVVAHGAYKARREKSSVRVFSLVGLLVWGTAIGLGLVFIYARATGGRATVSQAAITSYLIVSLLLILRALRSGIEHVGRRVVQQHAGRRYAGAMRLLVGAGQFAALFAIGLPLVMAVLMTFRPKVLPKDNPQSLVGHDYESVSFPTSDGLNIGAWWIPSHDGRSRHAKQTILVCHGLGSSKSNQLFLAGHLLQQGWNVLAIDHRAHGESDGQITTFGDRERLDVLAAVRWLHEHHPEQAARIYGLGASMGAAALVAAAADDSDEGQYIDGLVLYGTYDDLGAMTYSYLDYAFPWPLDRLLYRLGMPIASLHAGRDLTDFAPGRMISRVWPRPVMVIHGVGDHIIDFPQGRRLYEQALQPKQKIWLEKGDHNSILEDEDTARRVVDFLDHAESLL